MCGILFALNSNDKKTFIERLKTLQPRGPDEMSTISTDTFMAGHTRNCIVNPLHGKQPIQNDTWIILHNGEIYNGLNTKKNDFNENINLKDIPELWNQEYKRLFAKEVDKDSNGCLQDVHWYAGLFGYFPTYSLGALTAAQLASQLREDVKNLDQQVEKGDFNELIEWLKLNIHSKASLYSTNEILQQVTNSELNAKYFMDYIKNRYL